MGTNQEIHEFALKWLKKYSSNKTTEHEVEEHFSEECFSLGFQMDCGDSLEAAFPKLNALQDYSKFKLIIDKINDISLLAIAIFSKWRYITHWAYCDNLLSSDNRSWFIAAFSRLAYLSSEDEEENKIHKDK